MTGFDPYEALAARLPGLLVDIAAPRVPDYTDEVLAQTAGIRQRPRWTFPERWLPMIITRQRVAVPRVPWRGLAVVAALLALVALTLLLVGSPKRLPPPFGLARNGAVLFNQGDDIYIRDAIDGRSRPLIDGPGDDFAAAFTRNGEHVMFLRRTVGASGGELFKLYVANADGSDPVDVSGSLIAPNWFDLSPDDSTVVVHAVDPSRPATLSDDLRSKLYLLDLSRPGAPKPLDLPVEWATTPSFRGPDGAEIVFRGGVLDGPLMKTAVFAVRPDGTGFRALTAAQIATDAYQQPLLSPDGRFLTYTNWDRAAGQLGIHIRDLQSGIDRMITPSRVDQGYATFSPDGERITFVEYAAGRDQIRILSTAPGSTPVAAGPSYPMIDGQYISSAFSPDGKWVVVNDPASGETRLVDAATGGNGDLLPWAHGSLGGWQRLAP